MTGNKLKQALEQQDLEMLEKLIKEGENPNSTDDDVIGCTPLHHAVEELEEGGSLDAIKILINNGADVNKWNTLETATPLILAVFNENIDAAQILLDAGADTNVNSGQGDTPLRWSVEENNYDMVTLLLKYGGNGLIDEFGGDMGLTALGIAASQLNIRMIKLLVDAGANIEEIDDEYLTAREQLPERSDQNQKEWEAAMLLLSG